MSVICLYTHIHTYIHTYIYIYKCSLMNDSSFNYGQYCIWDDIVVCVFFLEGGSNKLGGGEMGGPILWARIVGALIPIIKT